MRDWKHSPKPSSSVTFFSNTISVGKIAQISKRKTHSAGLCAFFKSFGMKRSVWPLPTSFLPNDVEKKMRALELRPIWGVIWVRYGISFAYFQKHFLQGEQDFLQFWWCWIENLLLQSHDILWESKAWGYGWRVLYSTEMRVCEK